MSTVTYQQVLDATERIELHHFQGTTIVVCCLVAVDGRVILGVGTNTEGDTDFDVTRNSIRARDAANAQLASELESRPVAATPAPEGATPAADAAPRG